MKIEFEDNSFIKLESSPRQDKVVCITMCGVNPEQRRIIMSSLDLDDEQLQVLMKFLKKYTQNQ